MCGRNFFFLKKRRNHEYPIVGFDPDSFTVVGNKVFSFCEDCA